jgi:hypothetical protein
MENSLKLELVSQWIGEIIILLNKLLFIFLKTTNPIRSCYNVKNGKFHTEELGVF